MGGREDTKSFISPKLKHPSAVAAHHSVRQRGTAIRQPRRSVVTMPNRETGVSSHIGNEEREKLRALQRQGG